MGLDLGVALHSSKRKTATKMWGNRTRSRPRPVHLSSELACLFRTSYLHRNLKGSSLLWVPPRPPPPRLPPSLRSQQGRGSDSLAGVCVPVPSFSLLSLICPTRQLPHFPASDLSLHLGKDGVQTHCAHLGRKPWARF